MSFGDEGGKVLLYGHGHPRSDSILTMPKYLRSTSFILMLNLCIACTGSTVDELRPDSGKVMIDLTNAEHAEWFLANTRAFYRVDQDAADDYIYMEVREGRGVCFAISANHEGFEDEDITPWFEDPVDHWASGEPIPPRIPKPGTERRCDSCAGITIPYFTPKSLSVELSSINIAPENLDDLFVDTPGAADDLELSTPFSRGFIGLLTRVPAQAEGDNVIPGVIKQDSYYEFAYLRPANGEAVPGPFAGGGIHTTVQYGATFYEWFVTRTRAFEEGTSAEGELVNLPVFEGPAVTVFGDTDPATLATDINTIELDFDDGEQQIMRVNGADARSSVTGEFFDRTIMGSVIPNNSRETLSVITVEPGTYGCVRSITLEL